MQPNKNEWSLGEIAKLQREEKPLKQSGLTVYEQFVASRYLCIREATDSQRGILLKVLGKTYSDEIKIIGGQPFSRDDHEQLFDGHRFFSYPFPKVNQVREVLEILKDSPDLQKKMEDAKMHLNPNSGFWVSETARNAFFLKIPQIYDTRSNQLRVASDDTSYYRITMVYFFKGELIW